jgi:hypothetical protein
VYLYPSAVSPEAKVEHADISVLGVPLLSLVVRKYLHTIQITEKRNVMHFFLLLLHVLARFVFTLSQPNTPLSERIHFYLIGLRGG